MVTWQGASDVANETDCSMSIGRLRLMIAKQGRKRIVKTAVRKKVEGMRSKELLDENGKSNMTWLVSTDI